MGRVAAMFSAHSTAVAAAIRRLSEAAHNHRAIGQAGVGLDRNQNIALSGSVHVAGRLFRQTRDGHMFPGQRLGDAIDLDRLFHFDMQGQGVSVKDGRLQQQKREQGRVLAGDPLIVLEHALLYRIQRRDGLLAVARHHVEGHLGVEHFFRQLLEGQQVHGLLVEFVHALLSVLGRRLEDRGHDPLALAPAFFSRNNRSASTTAAG